MRGRHLGALLVCLGLFCALLAATLKLLARPVCLNQAQRMAKMSGSCFYKVDLGG